MKVLQTIKSKPTMDGNEVRISRVADFHHLRLDPFLMIDELKSDDKAEYIGGFPPHPHRGIETFTYIRKGGFEHRDQLGNRKTISAGDVQWMSTGYGVVHSEMPVAESEGMHGFQIWINMPARDKLREARYQDSVEEGLPEMISSQGATLTALAGKWQLEQQSVVSPLNDLASDASIADLYLPESTSVVLDRSVHDQVFILVYQGELNGFTSHSLLITDPQVPLDLKSGNASRALVFSANKLREQIVHYGPFVMNTQDQLQQAFQDYRAGKFGSI